MSTCAGFLAPLAASASAHRHRGRPRRSDPPAAHPDKTSRRQFIHFALAYVPVLEPQWAPPKIDPDNARDRLLTPPTSAEADQGSYLRRRLRRILGTAPNTASSSDEDRPLLLPPFLPSTNAVDRAIWYHWLSDLSQVAENSLLIAFHLMGIAVAFAISVRQRTPSDGGLPNTYKPDEIRTYFLLRPDRALSRLLTVSSIAASFAIGYYIDSSAYSLSRAARRLYTRAVLIPARNLTTRNKAIFRAFNSPNPTLARQARARRKDYWDWRWQRRASLLRQKVTHLGPAFIKLGQALASRPDLVGAVAARELQRLQDDIPLFPNDQAFAFIQDELGAHPSRIFDVISDQPVAAASLGQVYKGVLDNIDVAVKVQRPGLPYQIALDFFIVRVLASAAEKVFAIKTDLVGATDEYAVRLFEEIDYINEGRNIAKFRTLYGHLPGIYVPQVFLEYTTPHVLVMEWIQGAKLVDETLNVRPEDLPLIKVGISCSLTQLLEKGFLHCDPHASNLMRTADGRLAYIDFGLVSTVPQAVMYSLLRAILHLISRDYKALAEDFAGLALMRSEALESVGPQFALALEDLFDPMVDRGVTSLSFEGIAEKLLSLAARFPLVLPPYFINNVRALAILEGLALTADPDFQLFSVIYPYVLGRVLYDPDPQLVGALESLILTDNGEIQWNRLEGLLRDAQGLTTDPTAAVDISQDLLIDFIVAPGGRVVRRVLLDQLIGDLSFRFQCFVDNVETIMLPPTLLPPSGSGNQPADPELQATLRTNRVRAKNLLIRVRAFRSFRALRLVPTVLTAGVRIVALMIRAVVARILMDMLYVFNAIRHRRKVRKSIPVRKGTAVEVPNNSQADRPVDVEAPPMTYTTEAQSPPPRSPTHATPRTEQHNNSTNGVVSPQETGPTPAPPASADARSRGSSTTSTARPTNPQTAQQA